MAVGVGEIQDEELERCGVKKGTARQPTGYCQDPNIAENVKTYCGRRHGKIVRWPNTLVVDLVSVLARSNSTHCVCGSPH